MAQLECPHCGGKSFAVSTEQLEHATYPLCVVRCASCNAPFGVLQTHDPNRTIREESAILGNLIDRISLSLGQIGEGLAKDVAEILRRLPEPKPKRASARGPTGPRQRP